MDDDKKTFPNQKQIRSALGVVLLAALAGCVNDPNPPRQGSVYVEPPPAVFVVQDDYVYYPQYEVYYSNSRRQYAYRENNVWVSRPAPPGVTVNVLRASPSVRMDFHDSPQYHHAVMSRQYPKNWRPPATNQGQKQPYNQHGGGK